MAINLVIAVTDGDWFDLLRKQPNLAEVNFWAPSAANFRALQPGELFLFKLHAPRNVIVGGGIFAYATALPCSLAWEAFREANGARSAQEMRSRIARYRRADPGDRSDFEIRCRVLTQPFFFEEADWISVPASWAANIVSFKTYSTSDADGLALWDAVNDRLNRPNVAGMAEAQARFGEPQLIQPRLGQGAFRVTHERICQRSKPRIFAPTATAANMRPETDSCFGVTSIACSMRAM
jgi:putative restriction endonuclease